MGTTRQLSRNARAALSYAKAGHAVFPCCWPFNGKCDCGFGHEGRDIGKAPLVRHGLNDATQLISGVFDYWTRWPKANIAWAIDAQHFVIDVDADHHGYQSLEAFQRKHGALPETRMNNTGGGGQHYLYSTSVEIRNSPKLGGFEGIEIRGHGGYIILPPSEHRSGTRYKTSEIWDGPITEAPNWLIDLGAKKQAAGAPSNLNAAHPILEGQRNDALARDAGAMRRRGLSVAAIYAALRIENLERCQPPLPDDEVQRIATSVARYSPAPQPDKFASARAAWHGGVTL